MMFFKKLLMLSKKNFSLLKNVLYSKTIFFIYKNNYTPLINCLATIKIVNEYNLTDVLCFNKIDVVDKFKTFIKNGDKGYYAYLNDDCVHRSWVVFGPKEISIINNYKKKLNKNEAYIHYCETSFKARGKGVYPFVLANICKDFSDKVIYLMTLCKKKNACRAVEKAGFVKEKVVEIKRILGFTIIKEKLILTQTKDN